MLKKWAELNEAIRLCCKKKCRLTATQPDMNNENQHSKNCPHNCPFYQLTMIQNWNFLSWSKNDTICFWECIKSISFDTDWRNALVLGRMYRKILSSFRGIVGQYCYNAVSPEGTCIVNAYCQFLQQACTNFMKTYSYSLISTNFFILMTNLHCQMWDFIN